LAGPVLLEIAYLLVRLILGFAVLMFRRDLTADAELLVLRHKNAVLRRQVKWIRYEPADRVWFTALTQLVPAGAENPVTPPDLDVRIIAAQAGGSLLGSLRGKGEGSSWLVRGRCSGGAGARTR
jgi:hypothetical protein